jgi:ribonuclease HII
MMPIEYPFNEGFVAGCDEAGRGCLAGPVYAAAVIFEKGYHHNGIRDSKKIPSHERDSLALEIIDHAVAWGIGIADAAEIDRINILKASILAMHRALDNLAVRPSLVIADGNRFLSYQGIPHRCIVKGDALYLCIAAASILAKVYRDRYMKEIAQDYPAYGWEMNKGYPTYYHRKAIYTEGLSPYHRRTFRGQQQLTFDYEKE